jgi:hypothetical protein
LREISEEVISELSETFLAVNQAEITLKYVDILDEILNQLVLFIFLKFLQDSPDGTRMMLLITPQRLILSL